MTTADLLVDSKEGIEALFDWARAHRFVLYPYHEQIAAKHGVSTEGVIFTRPLPRGDETLKKGGQDR